MQRFIIFNLVLLSTLVLGQEVTFITHLDSDLSDSSGVIVLDDKLITHNDYGGEPRLFEVDQANGEIIRTVTVSNATNTDWEDITYDDNYIYIGDFGNNNGTRTDLKIYKIAIQDYRENNTVTAEVINFNYANQTDFTYNSSTNFNAEALISYEDSLYIFTKDMGDYSTRVYPLSKNAGTYSISSVASFDVDGLITGADYNSLSGSVMLIGYNASYSTDFVVEISNFSSGFSNANMEKYEIEIPNNASTKIEGIAHVDKDTYDLTAEANGSLQPSLLQLKVENMAVVDINEETNPIVYPNPATDVIHIKSTDIRKVEIYTINGKYIKSSTQNEINVSNLPRGLYIFKVNETQQSISQKVLIK